MRDVVTLKVAPITNFTSNKGIAINSKKLLVAPGIATSNEGHCYQEQGRYWSVQKFQQELVEVNMAGGEDLLLLFKVVSWKHRQSDDYSP